MKLKVCGMKYKENIVDVSRLQPDFLGFIFYKKSPRYFKGSIPDLPDNIKKIGVFVNASIDTISSKINDHNLRVIQLHGNESPEFCKTLQKLNIKVIKVFSVNESFNFEALKPFEEVCDYYLFDTKGELPGGNGYIFNWNTLKDYPSTKPYFLSGGIGLDELEDLQEFAKSSAARYCYAVDVNSKFELQPGIKNTNKLKTFRNDL